MDTDLRSPIVGNRVYNLRPDGFLCGQFLQVWENKTMLARCNGEDVEPHLRTGEHTCGIYIAQKTSTEYYINLLDGAVGVEAKVHGWGVCVEGETGTRCQYCTIDSLEILISTFCTSCFSRRTTHFKAGGWICKQCVEWNSVQPQSLSTIDEIAKKVYDRYLVPVTMRVRELTPFDQYC